MFKKELSRRDFMKISSLAMAGLIGNSQIAKAEQPQRPNILWIIAEDISHDLGCYDMPLVKTPRIDQLANEGIKFNRAYTTSGVCSPSRSAFMTGMYQTTIGSHDHRSHQSDGYTLPTPVKVITEYFRQAGYFTCNGKGGDTSQWGKTDWNWTYPTREQSFDGTDWSQRASGQPFFAQVNFYKPHRDFSRDWSNPINPDDVTDLPLLPDHPVTRRDWANYLETIQLLDSEVGQLLDRLDNEGLADNTIVVFFGDNGRPFNWCKQWLYEGGIKVPLIIRWPGNLNAGAVSEELVSAIDLGPTCMKWAGIDIPGHIQGRPIYDDYNSTIVDTGNMRLGLKTKGSGRKYIFAARDTSDNAFDRIRCVVTKRFKYIRNFYPQIPYTDNPGQPHFENYISRVHPAHAVLFTKYYQGTLKPQLKRFMDTMSTQVDRPADELFDLYNDPDELNNIAADDTYADIKKHLSNRLDQWISETNDLGEIEPANPNEHVDFMKNVFCNTLDQRGGTAAQAADLFRAGDFEQAWQTYLQWWQQQLL